MHNSQMQIVELARETGRGQLLEKARHNGVDFKVTVDAVPGRPQLIELMVKNPLGSEEVFKVSFTDTDSEGVGELKLVNNTNGEWEFWV